MNKNILIIGAIGIILVIIVGGGMLFLNQQNSNDAMMADKSEDAVMEDDQMDNSTSDENMSHGSSHPDQIGDSVSSHHYLSYSADALSQASDGKRVLFFYADWCPTCRPVDAQIQANTDKIPENTTIIRVNYNDTDTDQEEKDLARKYDVTYQHTFVLIDENGNEVEKWNGGGLDEVLSRI